MTGLCWALFLISRDQDSEESVFWCRFPERRVADSVRLLKTCVGMSSMFASTFELYFLIKQTKRNQDQINPGTQDDNLPPMQKDQASCDLAPPEGDCFGDRRLVPSPGARRPRNPVAP